MIIIHIWHENDVTSFYNKIAKCFEKKKNVHEMYDVMRIKLNFSLMT